MLPTVGATNTPGAAVLSCGPSAADLMWRSAGFVDRILSGARPADLPVELPTKFDFIVNLKLATALGLTVSPALLAHATQTLQ